MRAFLAVARREIEEKRFVFGAALVASIVPFVPLIRGLRGQPSFESREILVAALAGAFAVGLGMALGATVLASDLADRRIGFYFSRPVSGLALWAGKLGAACFVAVGAAAVVSLPALAVDRHLISAASAGEAAPIIVLGAVTAALVFHSVAIALRERSILLVADLAALVVASMATTLVLRRLVLSQSMEFCLSAINVLPLAVAIAIAAGGLVAILRGRSDIHAAHRALSATLWIGVVLGVAALGSYSLWVLSATPQSVAAVDSAVPARQGSWIIVQGEARGGTPVFLVNPITNAYRRTGGDWQWPVISPDGKRAVWFERSEPGGLSGLVQWDLGDTSSLPTRTHLSFAESPRAFLSEHGERFALVNENLLAVYDLRSEALLASARLGPEHAYARGFFPDAEHFRLYRVKAPEVGGIEILELDIARKALAATGEMVGAEHLLFTVSASGARILLREKTRLSLRDGRSGALIASLAERGPTMNPSGTFLSDGRVAVSIVERSAVRIEVFAPDGSAERTITIPARYRISLGGEVAPGKVVVAAGGSAQVRESRTIFVADLSSGAVVKVADGLFPICSYLSYAATPDSVPAPGSEATKLFYGAGRSLVRLDPLTGERRVILGKGE